ncbi:hypothetical protein ACQJBY_005980 [Aegilops geniculata]
MCSTKLNLRTLAPRMCCSVSGLSALLGAEVGVLSLCTGVLMAALRLAALDNGKKEELGPPATPGRRPSSLELKAAKRWLRWCCSSAEQSDVNLLWAAAVHEGARQQRHVHSTLKDELLLFLMLAPCCRYTSLLTSPNISSWSRQLHMMKTLILDQCMAYVSISFRWFFCATIGKYKVSHVILQSGQKTERLIFTI